MQVKKNTPESLAISPLQPVLPDTRQPVVHWGRLYGNSAGLLIASGAKRYQGVVLVVTPDMQQAIRLEYELRFYSMAEPIRILSFPDWETLPYDLFSPHQDIVSQRLETLSHLPQQQRGVLIVPISTLMQRLPPRTYIQAISFLFRTGETLIPDQMRLQLDQAGYRYVSQVMEHGEYTLRGSIIDLFPMGSPYPFRIDLFDQEIESIRTFHPESQRTIDKVEEIRLLPAHEFPLDEDGITQFRQAYRKRFEGDPNRSVIYQEISQANPIGGIEYYLPLFFTQMESLLDYLPQPSLLIQMDGADTAAEKFWTQIQQRYESRRHDIERPILAPDEIFIEPGNVLNELHAMPRVHLQNFEHTGSSEHGVSVINYATSAPPPLLVQNRALEPHTALLKFLQDFKGRILIAAETTGRRELIIEMLRKLSVFPKPVNTWHDFLASDIRLAITIAPLDQGLVTESPALAIVAESQLFGTRAIQQRRRTRHTTDAENIIRNLTDLHIGAPVVHEEHGVGRYLGLQKLSVGRNDAEFLTLEYAGGDKLYVPVASLHLISRYSGAAPESAPLHRLGSEQWQKAKRKAAERAHDVAAELLDIYARRAAKKGHAYTLDQQDYEKFANAFPFEETPDQMNAIEAVVKDMQATQPMDRVICGDVGFGKTEVAMRAAFVAVQGGRQTAVLVPTTLLAQQHYQNFIDRFSDWPFQIDVLSRFRTAKEQEDILKKLADGKIDIIIGTHKLLQKDIRFENLGLLIIDEEHRFGVRQKERLKSLRAQIDILTLTATPIPRTLNMSLTGLRDLSIIATPPVERVAIKTFVTQWDDALLTEAFLREIKRGGQVYFLHNEVSTIEKTARTIQDLIPDARIGIAHGQMRERDLEQVMLDFYHQKFNILVCSTIIESGIDVPTANTIIINRADKLGLAQLHQLRGRVGRSHHRAYAYLVIPGRKLITADALKRLEAIESLEDLGAGFMLSTHDLEIRGAGELLGEDQSGQIHEVGFSLYTELLERAVKSLKSGQQPDLDQPLYHGPEIDLHLPALIPDDYLPDIHTRLIMYKRIANAESEDSLREIQVEMIDRFGLLPEQAKNLIRITELKLMALTLGIVKIDAGENGGRILFGPTPNIDAVTIIQLIQKKPGEFKLEGQDKLRISADLSDNATRFDYIEKLLLQLRVKEPGKLQ